MAAIDHNKTFVLAIGASNYPEDDTIDSIPNVNVNIEYLRTCLVDTELIGIPDNKLYLVTADTKTEYLGTDGIGIDEFRTYITGSMGDMASRIQSGLLEFEGTYIMTSAADDSPSFFPLEDKFRPTYFTGKFIDILRRGIDNNQEYCSLRQIYNEIRVDFALSKLPTPQQYNLNTAEDSLRQAAPSMTLAGSPPLEPPYKENRIAAMEIGEKSTTVLPAESPYDMEEKHKESMWQRFRLPILMSSQAGSSGSKPNSRPKEPISKRMVTIVPSLKHPFLHKNPPRMRSIFILTMPILAISEICSGQAVRPGYFNYILPTGNVRLQEPGILYEATFGGYSNIGNAQAITLGGDSVLIVAGLYEDAHWIGTQDTAPSMDITGPVPASVNVEDLKTRTAERRRVIESTSNQQEGLSADYRIKSFYQDDSGSLVYCYNDIYQTGLLKWAPATQSPSWEVFLDSSTEIRTVQRRKDRFILCSREFDEVPFYIMVGNGTLITRRKETSETYLLFFNGRNGSLLDTVPLHTSEPLESYAHIGDHIFLFFPGFVMAVDRTGKILFEKKHPFLHVLYTVADTSKNIYLVNTNDSGSFVLHKLDRDLKPVWKKQIAADPEGNTSINDLKITSRNELLLTIDTQKGFFAERESWSRLMKLDTSGRLNWEYTMTGPSFQSGRPYHYIQKIIPGDDGLYYYLSYSSSLDHVFDYYSLSCIDDQGIPKWRRFIDDYSAKYTNIFETTNGNIALIGYLDEKDGGLITIMDKNGAILSNRSIEGDDGIFNTGINIPGGILLLGEVTSLKTNSTNNWILATKL